MCMKDFCGLGRRHLDMVAVVTANLDRCISGQLELYGKDCFDA